MRKTRNMYNWFRNLSAVLAACFLMSNTAIAQSINYEPEPTNEVSAWEWSGIQDFIDWLTFQITDSPRYRQKAVTQSKVNFETTAKNVSLKKIRIPTRIIVTDISVRESGDD